MGTTTHGNTQDDGGPGRRRIPFQAVHRRLHQRGGVPRTADPGHVRDLRARQRGRCGPGAEAVPAAGPGRSCRTTRAGTSRPRSHQAVGYARHTRRRQTFAISTSIGPGSSNLLTGAALATTNRLPVLLLPSDTFATRAADPVLQQLEQPYAYDITVNDAFRPLSKFFDRVNRPGAAVLRVPPRPARPDGPGRDRRGDHLAAAGCPGRGLRCPRGVPGRAGVADPPPRR